MRAVIADHPGGPEVLHSVTLPDPEPADDQVRVAVEVAAITFIDTMIRAGSPVAPPATFPVVLGNGVGGVIDRLGPRVDPDWMGVQVVSTTGGAGGYAGLAVARVDDLHRVPDGLGLHEATALLADGRTALGLHEAARIQPGETVVVTAAAGGVGSILVQLARAAGGRVIALAGSATKLEHARTLGAATGLNYRDPGWIARIREVAPHGVDVVFDGVGADTTRTLLGLLRAGGRFVQHGAAGGEWVPIDEAVADDRGLAVIGLSQIGATGMFGLTERALDLGSRGVITPTIGQTFSLDDAAAAHSAIESRSTTGKTLLLP